jgi:hypothetical protein
MMRPNPVAVLLNKIANRRQYGNASSATSYLVADYVEETGNTNPDRESFLAWNRTANPQIEEWVAEEAWNCWETGNCRKPGH